MSAARSRAGSCWAAGLACWLGAYLTLACATSPAGHSSAPLKPLSREPLEFTLGTVDGGLLTARALRGRIALLTFATTFDLASQQQARVLEDLLHSHRPRLNVALVALEPPDHAVLVAAFRNALGLDFPVAMAELAERTAFESTLRIERVPTTLILDGMGRPLFKRVGLVQRAELEALLRRAERVPAS